VEGDAIHLALSAGRWKGMWILPEMDDATAPLVHVENYPITRYRVRMEVVAAGPAGIEGLRAFRLDALEAVPIPSPHRRAIEALARMAGDDGGKPPGSKPSAKAEFRKRPVA
jgi:hypothetical protein